MGNTHIPNTMVSSRNYFCRGSATMRSACIVDVYMNVCVSNVINNESVFRGSVTARSVYGYSTYIAATNTIKGKAVPLQA
jgi:hypothetical protein